MIGLVIVAIYSSGRPGAALAAAAAIFRRRLPARKEFTADHLGIGLQQPEAIAVAVPDDFVVGQFGEGSLKLDIAREGLAGRTHEWIQQIVANTGQRAKADHVAGTSLRTIAAGGNEEGMLFRQPQLRPNLGEMSRRRALATNIFLVSSAVIEQIEFEQLDALVFEIEQRTVDTAAVWTEKIQLVR